MRQLWKLFQVLYAPLRLFDDILSMFYTKTLALPIFFLWFSSPPALKDTCSNTLFFLFIYSYRTLFRGISCIFISLYFAFPPHPENQTSRAT